MKIVVIGSGFGGLAAAIRCRANGHDVTMVEKRDKPGGRAYVTEKDGFKFDNGPTIITAPWMIEELFAAAGKKLSDYATLTKLDPFYRIRFEDGSCFTYNDDHNNLLDQIRSFNPKDVDGYRRFMKHVDKIYGAGFKMITTPFHKFRTMLQVLPELIWLRSDRSVAKLASKFFKDPRLQQVFSFHPLLIGGHPFESTSVYALIHKLEQESGVWYCQGGTGALVEAMIELFLEIGGKLQLNSEVKRIEVDQKTHKATGVTLVDGSHLKADSVVCNGDVARTYTSLVDSRVRSSNSDSKYKGYEYSMSLFVIYFGTKVRYDQMAHHEIIMGPRYRGLLDDIFKKKILADDFSLYLHRPTATDRTMAPENGDAFYVLSPVPNLAGNIDWSVEGPKYRDSILRYLEDRYLPDLSKNIVTQFYIDPTHFDKNLNSHLGSAFSVAPSLFQSAWFRPHNISEDIGNLYFTGAGTHPGAGVPGVISSGKIVSDMIGI